MTYEKWGIIIFSDGDIQVNPQDDELIFADEIQFRDEETEANPEKLEDSQEEFWKVMVVDDEPQVHTVTELVLRGVVFKGKKIKFYNAYSALEAKKVLAENPDICLALVDVVMEEDDAGLRLVEYIRNIMNNSDIRIILRTGQPGYAPEQEVIIDYDINDYKEKTEMSAQKLITCIIVAFRNYEYIMAMRKMNNELEQIVADRVADLREANRRLSETLETLQEDQDAGRKMQFRILPDAEKNIAGYRFSRSLFPSLTLSGDFVDYFEIGEKHIGFYMADVSGHGVSSAIVTVLLKNFIDNGLEKFNLGEDMAILDPVETCRRLNSNLKRDNLGKYLTIFYGIIDIEKNTLKYANCGQFPFPAVYDGTKACYIEDKGTPVGLFRNPVFRQGETVLPDNFSMFFASDGFLDILENMSVSEKSDYMLELVSNEHDSLDRIIEKLDLNKKENLPDDITFMLIKKVAD